MSSDIERLYREIVQQPADKTLRLVYSDALRERDGPGDGDHAEFIRLQIEHPETDLEQLWRAVAKRTLCCPPGWSASRQGRVRRYLNVNFRLPGESIIDVATVYVTDGFADSWECSQRAWNRIRSIICSTNPVRELRLNTHDYLVYLGDDRFHFERDSERVYSLCDVETMRQRYPDPKPTDDIGLLHLIRNPGLAVSESLERLPGPASKQQFAVSEFTSPEGPAFVLWQVPYDQRSLSQMFDFCDSRGLRAGTRIAAAPLDKDPEGTSRGVRASKTES